MTLHEILCQRFVVPRIPVRTADIAQIRALHRVTNGIRSTGHQKVRGSSIQFVYLDPDCRKLSYQVRPGDYVRL